MAFFIDGSGGGFGNNIVVRDRVMDESENRL
jgi:hypothetical protein